MTAFREGVEAMIPALRRYARALARDADVADDLVQDTLVRALRSERLFLGGDVRSWLYTILTNLNKNRRRSLAPRPQFMPLLDNNAAASGTERDSDWNEQETGSLGDQKRPVPERGGLGGGDNECRGERRGEVGAGRRAPRADPERVSPGRAGQRARGARYARPADEPIPKR